MLASAFARGEITTLEARMIGVVFVGEDVEVSGSVSAIERTTDGVRVRCSLVLHAGPGRVPAVTAEAVVGIPEPPPLAGCLAINVDANNED